MKVIISGGGTGGHVFPAIAIADALKAKASDVDILFVGAKGKLEMDRVPKAGYKIEGLTIAGFQRKLSPKNLLLPFKLIASMSKALLIIRRFKPDAAVGVGGYASGPVLKAASWVGVNTYIQEQNSFAGVTNKILAQKAKRIFVAYRGMERFFEMSKLLLTGNPVREAVYKQPLSVKDAKHRLGVDGKGSVVLISGGSLGARTLNKAMVANTELIAENSNVFFYWQAGKLYEAEFATTKVAQLPNVKMVSFIEDMGAAYCMSDVVIARAGALTISELTLVGKPTVLIPSPNVAEDHQTHNAMALVNEGAAIHIADSEAEAKMVKTALSLVNDDIKKESMKSAILKMGHTDAANTIAQCIIDDFQNQTS